MEKYETMDFFGVLYLYTFHNDIIRNLNMDHWLQNPLPAIGDSGLIFRHRGQCRHDPRGDRSRIAQGGTDRA
jgi:hypothetical protein